MNITIVVADNFNKTAQQEGVITFNELLKVIENKRVNDINFVAGQGLSDIQIEHIYTLSNCNNMKDNFTYWKLDRNKVLANKKESHKHNYKNILISRPVRTGDETFESNLIVNYENEFMQDHLTGEHIQGMMLIEASRQMFLAVKEVFYLKDFPAVKKYFVIEEMNTSYKRFLFPLRAIVRYTNLELSWIKPDHLKAHASIEILQNGKITTITEVKFSVYEGTSIESAETYLASKAILSDINLMRSQAKDKDSIILS